jgi:glutathione S-transferase
MLTFYHHPLSPISRRVWLALLEKKIAFQPIIVDLRGNINLNF